MSSVPVRILLTAWLMAGIAASARAAATASDPSPEPCPDAVASTGVVENWTFGFRFTIPEDLEGFWNSGGCAPDGDGCACLPDHGRFIPIPKGAGGHARRHVEVFAAPEVVIEQPTLAKEVRYELQNIRQRAQADTVRVASQSDTSLGSLPARHVVVDFEDRSDRRRRTSDFVVALRNGFRYLIVLETTPASYPRDRESVAAIARSFETTSGEYYP